MNGRAEAHKKAQEKAKETADTTKGSIDTLEKSLPGLEAEKNDAEQKLAENLAENGFATREDYVAALAPIGDKDGEAWLTLLKNQLDSHENDKKNTNENS